MNEERYVAAVEISSSKIIAAVGRISHDGQLTVTAVEQEHCVESVRYGIIQNLEETSIRLARILDRLERRVELSGRKITGIYVGLSGRSVRSIPKEVSMTLRDDTEIDDTILQRLRENALASAIDNSLEIVDAVPRIYKIGKTETHSPKGRMASHISATYDLIVCRPELKRNLARTIADKLGIHVQGFVVTALAAGHLILTDEEKRLGCMFVDMGAETTTVTLYKNGNLRYFETLPLGGRNITRDLTSLNLLEEKAEETKITSGRAIASDNPSTININGIKFSDVSNLIVARAEEIVANILEQIDYAGMTEKDLPAGVICIGGASKLNGILDLISNISNLPVKRGSLPAYVAVDDPKAHGYDLLEVVSVLYASASLSDAPCLEEPKAAEVPATGVPNALPDDSQMQQPPRRKRSTIFTKLQNGLTSLFKTPYNDDEDDLLE